MFFRLTLFFAFFNSFAIINFDDFNWGLLWSWFLSLIFINLYFYKSFIFSKKIIYDYRNTYVLKIFGIIFLSSTISWLMQWLGLILIPRDYDISINRSFGHVGYIFFYFLVYICIYSYLKNNNNKYFIYYKWFFIYPFIFISFWGIYQNLSTYGFFNYVDIFNNSVSTGFTYERFKEDHRVSSVFPEPSEYSYYLALMTPIVWAYFRNIPFKSNFYIRSILLILLISQIYMIKSLSYFVAFPIIFWVIIRYIENLKGLRLFGAIFLAGSVSIILVSLTMLSRLELVSSGSDGSIDDRFLGILQSIELFLRSPLIGFGYGISRGIDQLFFLLASVGLIGIFFISKFLYKLLSNEDVPVFLKGSTLAMFASCLTSNNIFGFLFFWIYLAFLTTFPKNKKLFC
jgi:hypothetical protein